MPLPRATRVWQAPSGKAGYRRLDAAFGTVLAIVAPMRAAPLLRPDDGLGLVPLLAAPLARAPGDAMRRGADRAPTRDDPACGEG